MTILFVALTVVLLLVVDWLVHRRRADREPVPAEVESAPVRLPEGVFFARSHTWLNLFPSGRAWLGIDDFVTRLLDRPRVRFLRTSGALVSRGEPLFELTDGEHRLTIRSPLDGTVLATNKTLERQPDLLQRAPFGGGWACEIKPARHGDLKALMLGAEAAAWMREEFRRLRDVLAGADPALSPAMLQDGGTPIAGAMKQLEPEIWSRFEQEFLEVRSPDREGDVSVSP